MVWRLHGKGLLARGAAVGAFLRRCQKLPHVRQRQLQLTLKQTHRWAHQWFWEHLFDNIFDLPVLILNHKSFIVFCPPHLLVEEGWQNGHLALWIHCCQPRPTHHNHSCTEVTVPKCSTHPETQGSSLIILSNTSSEWVNWNFCTW